MTVVYFNILNPKLVIGSVCVQNHHSHPLCLIDGAYLAVASHDNFVYIYSVTENGRKYSRVGKCTVSSTTE